MPLYRIVCFSLLKATAPARVTADVAAILRQAAAQNPAQNITGALVYGDGYFAGLVEGRRRYVADFYNGVVADPRQVAVQLVSAGPIAERLFTDWRQADLAANASARALVAKYGPGPQFTPADLAPGSLVALICRLVAQADRPALTEVEELAWDGSFRLPPS